MRSWRVVRHHESLDGRVWFFRGDGTERCLVCGWRSTPSWYVGQAGRWNDEGLPERFPVCDEEHGLAWMRHVWLAALEQERV